MDILDLLQDVLRTHFLHLRAQLLEALPHLLVDAFQEVALTHAAQHLAEPVLALLLRGLAVIRGGQLRRGHGAVPAVRRPRGVAGERVHCPRAHGVAPRVAGVVLPQVLAVSRGHALAVRGPHGDVAGVVLPVLALSRDHALALRGLQGDRDVLVGERVVFVGERVVIEVATGPADHGRLRAPRAERPRARCRCHRLHPVHRLACLSSLSAPFSTAQRPA
mmetsp:Transcript_36192/g.107490  ORF Transcript_36192/g.107490 Transcript_36192/m.107490 type:complete len:220 (-) Transcript_36192:9-668(-)